jgi:protein-tyrosine phosphatase
LYLGCEVHLSPENLEAVLRNPQQYTLNGRDCLLVELPDQIHPPAADVALELLASRLRLIIAHPERNSYLQRHPSYAGELVKRGYFLQLTAQSLLGRFGAEAKSTSEEFLRKRWVHLVASDAHNLTSRLQILSGAHRQVERLYGGDTADMLFCKNPRAVLFGGDLSLPPSGWKLPLFRTGLSEKTPA